MSHTIDIPAGERGLIRVFALSMSDVEAQALKMSPAAVEGALGARALDPAHVEIFPVSDLEDLKLSGYLMEGGAVPEPQLGPDRAKLDALSGWVLVLYSLAFADRETVLRPAPELTLIGTYGERRTDYSSSGPLEAESARPETAPPPPARKKRSDAAMSGMVATFVLILLGLFTWLFIWIGG